MPNPSDNAFGAPTEGLGQTVTFVPQAQDAGGLQIGQESTQVNAGVRGGQFENRTTTLAVQVPESPLLNAVAKLGNATVQKSMAEARLKNYTAGLLSAGTEKGVKEIADGMPWYTYIMGGSDVLEGMRVGTAEKKMADWVGSVYQDLPNMAKSMSRAKAEEYLHNGVKGLFTGDQATDSYIVQAAAKHLPTLASAFTKLEYKHNQEEGSRKFGEQLSSWGSLIQKQATLLNDDDGPGAALTREDFKRQRLDLVKQSIPPAGMADEVWQSGMASFLRGAADRGELHAVSAFKEAGVLEHLNDHQRAQVEAHIDHANRRVAADWEAKNAAQLTDLEFRAANADTDRTARDILVEAEAMNRIMRNQTGSTGSVFTPEQVQALGRRSMQAIQQARVTRAMHEQAQATKYAADRQAAVLAQQRRDDLHRLMATGNLDMARHLGISDAERDRFVIGQVEQARAEAAKAVAPQLAGLPPERAAAVLQGAGDSQEVRILHQQWQKAGFVVSELTDRWAQLGKTVGSMMANGFDDSVMNGESGVYTKWRKFLDVDPSGAFARKVWGPVSDQLFEYHRAYTTSGNGAMAYHQAFVKATKTLPSDDDTKAVLSAVRDKLSSWRPAWMRSGDEQELAPASPGKLAVVVPRKIDVDGPTARLMTTFIGHEAATIAKQRGMKIADVVPALLDDMTQGDNPAVEPIGRYVIQNIGKAQPNAFVKAVVYGTWHGNPPPSDKIDEALNDFIIEKAKPLLPKDAVISELYSGPGGRRVLEGVELYRGASQKLDGKDDPTVSVFFTDNNGKRYNTAFSASELQLFIKQQGNRYATHGTVDATSAFKPGVVAVPHY